VTETSLRPEPLDLDLLREMYRGGAVNVAGIDPRLNATRIARRLRVGRARVAARLKAWKASGLLLRYDVWLNPALLGWRGAAVNIRVDHPRVKPALFGRLGLIDGAVIGLEFLGEWVSLGLVAPDDSSFERRIALIRGLAGVREVEAPIPWSVLEPKRELTALDIRIVRALRERPTATLSQAAHRVGISTRTMTRRYSTLVEDRAVWFVPIFDFRAISSPMVSLRAVLRTGVGSESFARQIRHRFPLTIDFRGAVAGPEPSSEVNVFVMPSSTAHVEELERFASSIEGVIEIEANIMVRMHSFSAWFDAHLETIASHLG
jgi:DNA-binding Lrp family transcriptional regulator